MIAQGPVASSILLSPPGRATHLQLLFVPAAPAPTAVCTTTAGPTSPELCPLPPQLL